MSVVYGALAMIATWCAMEALRPDRDSTEDENVAFGCEVAAALCVGAMTFLALAVGS